MNTRFASQPCRRSPVLAIFLVLATSCSAEPATSDPRDVHSPLRLVRTIPLPGVNGRIDHMALDTKSNHLFVAELGNGSVDEIDINSGSFIRRISGLHEPQGVAWLPRQDEIAIACGDGTVHFYRTSDLSHVASILLGDDADNVRVDARTGNLVVGYGSGALAVIDPSTHRVQRELKLPAHPEAFEILGSRVFVNVPNAHSIILGDLDEARVVKTLSTGAYFGNYPIAYDGRSRIAVAFRLPASLSLIDANTGASQSSTSICSDADDLYVRSSQVVVVCGSGEVQLVDLAGAHRRVRVSTRSGARTGLLDERHDDLFVAVPAEHAEASIWQLSFR